MKKKPANIFQDYQYRHYTCSNLPHFCKKASFAADISIIWIQRQRLVTLSYR